MESVFLVIHLILAAAIIGLVLLQRSEGGGLGIGGGGGGLGGFASAKGTANALTKMTAICAAGFFMTSLALGVLASRDSQQNVGLLEDVSAAQIEALSPSDVGEEDSQGGVVYTPPGEVDEPLAPAIPVSAPTEEDVSSEAADVPAVVDTLSQEDENSADNINENKQSEPVEPSAPVE